MGPTVADGSSREVHVAGSILSGEAARGRGTTGLIMTLPLVAPQPRLASSLRTLRESTSPRIEDRSEEPSVVALVDQISSGWPDFHPPPPHDRLRPTTRSALVEQGGVSHFSRTIPRAIRMVFQGG